MIEKQNDAESGDDLIEVVAVIEVPEHQEFEQQTEGERSEQRQHQCAEEVADHAVKRHSEIGAEHILGAVRQIDEIHHAEHQREAGRDQEQKNAELQSVQDLDEEERACHASSSPAK